MELVGLLYSLAISNVHMLDAGETEYLVYTPDHVALPWNHTPPYAFRTYSGPRRCAWSARSPSDMLVLGAIDAMRCTQGDQPLTITFETQGTRTHIQTVKRLTFYAALTATYTPPKALPTSH